MLNETKPSYRRSYATCTSWLRTHILHYDVPRISTIFILLFIYLNKDWRCVEHETSFLVQINYCHWFAWCMATAVGLLLLLNDKCKPESLQRDGRPGWRFPQTAGCKARICFVDSDKWRKIPSIGVFHQCWHQLKNFEKQRKGLRTVALNFWLVKAGHCYFRLFVPKRQCQLFAS